MQFIDTINDREYRRGNQKWAIQRNWQQDEDKQKKNTTQYVLDTIIHKQFSIRSESKMDAIIVWLLFFLIKVSFVELTLFIKNV
jgi:hypothetical protein